MSYYFYCFIPKSFENTATYISNFYLLRTYMTPIIMHLQRLLIVSSFIYDCSRDGILWKGMSVLSHPLSPCNQKPPQTVTSIRTFIFRQLYKGTVCPTPRCCWRLKLCQLGIYFHLLVPVCSNAKLLLQRMRIIIIMSLSSVGRREGINNHFRSSRGQ